MSSPIGLGRRLTPFFAVATLPLGILAFMFLGLEAAVAVFVVGWLFLVPASAVLFDSSWEESPTEELERVAELQELATELADDGPADTDASDPLDELRDRYARGELDDAEFERRLDALLETEALDPTDEAAVERVIEGSDGDDGDTRHLSESPKSAGHADDAELERE